MSKKLGSPKKPTKSRPSRNTKRSNGSTLTSSQQSARKHSRHERLATKLFVQSLAPQASRKTEEAVVEGVSMWPILRPGYRIRYRKINPEFLSPGDLIVVEARARSGEAQLRVHRLIGRTGNLFLEAGDNTFSASLVTAERILGRVEGAKDPRGRNISFRKWSLEESRFRYYLLGAQAFMFTHELKDRFLGGRRSLLLWRASQAYRVGLGALGLEVPTLFPKS